MAGGAIFAALNLASDGQWWLQAIVANVNDFDRQQAFGLFILWFKLHGLLLIPACLMLVYETYFDRLSIYSLWFAVTALLGGIASGTWGAGDSYFVTSIAALCILSGLFFSRILDGTLILPRQLRFLAGSPLCAAGILLIPLLYLGYARATLKLPTDGRFQGIAKVLGVHGNTRENFYDSATFLVGGYARIGYFLTPEDRAAGDRIAALIEATEGPVLSEEAGFTMAAGRDVVTNPTQLRNLDRAGHFNGERLVSMIDGQEFALVILRALFYPPAVLEAIDRAYLHRETIHMNGFDYLILYPRERDER